jgi:hypothetical protein
MNREQILGIIRHVLTAAGGALVVKGTISAGDLQIAAGAITSLIGVAWSILAPEKKAAR